MQFNMFTGYVSVLFLVASAVALDHPNAKILERNEPDIILYPYHVSIRYLGHHFCGGAIISEMYVITVAHCVFEAYGSYRNMKVLVGTNDITDESKGQLYKVWNVDIMYKYDQRTLENDVAILEIDGRIQFSPTVQKIELYDIGDPPPTELTVTGWGDVAEKSWGSKTLKIFTKKVIDFETCQKKYAEERGQISEQMFCVEQGACHGDDGAPAVDKASHRLVGLFSWSFGCNQGFPGVYIKLGEFRTYIKNRYGV